MLLCTPRPLSTLLKAFQNLRVSILRSGWITDFLELYREHFEKRPGLICPVFKPAKYVYDKQFFFEKPAEKWKPLLKAGQGPFRRFWRAFSKLKSFLVLLVKNLLTTVYIKFKAKFKKMWVSAGLSPSEDLSNRTSFSQL
jgi:hypothetical protein